MSPFAPTVPWPNALALRLGALKHLVGISLCSANRVVVDFAFSANAQASNVVVMRTVFAKWNFLSFLRVDRMLLTLRSMSRFALDLRKLRLLGPSPKR